MTAKRIGFAIRSHRYHGDDGFLVYQTSGGGFGTRIFARSREQAEQIRDALRRGDNDGVSRILQASYDERHRTP